MNSSRGTVRYVIGGILVALGVLLLLSNTDIINLDWGWDLVRTWWPLLLIIWGLWELVSGGFRFRLWPIILLLLGIGFQLSALNLWEWDFSVVWPAFIVIVGVAILLGRRRRSRGGGRRGRREGRRGGKEVHNRPSSGLIVEGTTVSGAGSGDSWRAVFNSVEETYAGQEFRGGEVETNFGNVALDLREAVLAGGSARLDVNLTFGGLHLRVPPGWRVNVEQVSAQFGHVQDNREHPEPDPPEGDLTIAGTVTFGNLEISG